MTADECAELRKKHYNATVAAIRWANSDLMAVRIRPDFPLPNHKPGQYSTLGLGAWEPRVEGCQPETISPADERKLIRRAYSISCPILDDNGALLDRDRIDWLEFYIVLVRETDHNPPALTPRLFNLKEGDRLFLGEKITGHFTLDPVKPADSVVFLSTGTGEAPHNYMLWDLLRRGHQGPILAACCVRYRRDLGYLALHEELMRRFPCRRLSIHQGKEDIRSALGARGQEAFGLENSHERQDRCVSIFSLERFDDLGDGSGAFGPNDLHDPVFGVGQSRGFLAWHGSKSFY